VSTDAAKKQADFLVRYALQSLGLILLVAVFLRTFLVSSYVMSGSSMLPSIWPGDFIMGAKWSLDAPKRGEIVIMKCPSTKERVCLKRVVAVAGDRVEFRDGALFVNGHAARAKPIGSDFLQENVEDASWAVWPGGKRVNSREPVIVPPQYVYVLNDKRADLEDSRTWGPVPAELMEARASRVWLSLDWFERSGELRNWPRVRWARMFRGIN
jgi:signal peptidase I